MCSALICGVVTLVAGAVLVITSTIVGFVVVPNLVRDGILNEVLLLDDTIQMERFEEVPFALNFTVRVFNISNAAEAMNGAVPVATEVGPYVYKLHSTRVIENIQEDKIQYRKLDFFEFDADASYPLTEDDILHVTNVAYHGVLQIAEQRFPEIMTLLNQALPEVFGDNTEPIVPVRVRDLLFDGISMCEKPGFLGIIACLLISQISADLQNMQAQPDGTVKLSMLGYRNGLPGGLMDAYRGINDPEDLGRITDWESSPSLSYWPDSNSVCNMINGTDSGIFNPFIDTEHPLYAVNSDICRSVELRYETDVEYNGITLSRFVANEWFLDNDDHCFCLNVTTGINRDDGCLLPGAMELYSCVVKAKDSDDEDYIAWKKPNVTAPIVTFTPPPDDAAPGSSFSYKTNVLRKKHLETFNIRQGQQINVAKAIFADGDDAFESLNGYNSNGSDTENKTKEVRTEVAPETKEAISTGNEQKIADIYIYNVIKEEKNRDKEVTLQKVEKEIDKKYVNPNSEGAPTSSLNTAKRVGVRFRGSWVLGAFMVLSYPHFLYADIRYRSGVAGMNPVVDDHRIYLDIEPNTGTVVRGAKRAQFNVFMRPVEKIDSTELLRTSLTPILWVEEGIMLPEEFTDQLKEDLLSTLELLSIVVPVAVGVCCVVLLIGIGLVTCAWFRRPAKRTVLTNE